MTSDEILALVQSLADITGVNVNLSVNIFLPPTGSNAIDPLPAPVPITVMATVTKDPRANAHFASAYNKAGRPVMAIYPSDNSDIKDRVQFARGTQVEAFTDAVQADGGDYFWQIVDSADYAEIPLYLREDDVYVA